MQSKNVFTLFSEQQDALVIALLPYLLKPISQRNESRKRKASPQNGSSNWNIVDDVEISTNTVKRPSTCEIQESMIVTVPVSNLQFVK